MLWESSGLMCREVEHFVDQLEGDPEIAAEAIRAPPVARPVGHHRADAASSTSPSATTETAQDFQNAQLTVSDHQLEGGGCRVWGVAFSPDARRAMTGSRDDAAWARDLPGSSPRERTSTRGGSKPDTRVSAELPFPWCFPVTPIWLPVRPI
jgi:hypothetical protein